MSHRFGGFESLQLGVIDVAPERTAARDPMPAAVAATACARRTMTGPRQDPRPARRPGRDPYGIGNLAPFLAPCSRWRASSWSRRSRVFALTGRVPFLGSPTTNGGSGGGGNIPPGRTPSPSAPPEVNPAIQVQGSLVYVKAGNLWIQSGNTPRQLTTTGRDSQPTWSPDGSWIYFIETRETNGTLPGARASSRTTTSSTRSSRGSTRMAPGARRSCPGSTRPGPANAYTWFWFILDPAVSPDGTRLAVVSDGPDPTRSDVVLQFIDVRTKRLTSAGLPENAPLGHQDPAWRPDGTSLLYVVNARNGSAGAPVDLALRRRDEDDGAFHLGRIHRAGLVAGRPVRRRRPDHLAGHRRRDPRRRRAPSWRGSPRTAAVRASTWSPDGTQIAFLRLPASPWTSSSRRSSATSNGNISVVKTDPLTTFSGLDGNSRPAWWAPAPPPAASPSPTPAASPSAPPPPASPSPS